MMVAIQEKYLIYCENNLKGDTTPFFINTLTANLRDNW